MSAASSRAIRFALRVERARSVRGRNATPWARSIANNSRCLELGKIQRPRRYIASVSPGCRQNRYVKGPRRDGPGNSSFFLPSGDRGCNQENTHSNIGVRRASVPVGHSTESYRDIADAVGGSFLTRTRSQTSRGDVAGSISTYSFSPAP
jgi:hypothetical protein